jgi:apolipoprotein N-acyltransferase
MASVVDPRRLGAAALTCVLSAVMVWFGTGLFPLWPLMWFAPLPVLLFAARASWWSTIIVATVPWLVGHLGIWRTLADVIGIPMSALAQIFGIESLVFAAAVLLYRALLRRGAWWLAIAAFPATRVAFEYLLNFITPHGTAGSLAYTQLGLLPFLQLASLTGPWGMTFVLLMFPALLATAWQLRGTPARALRVLGIGIAVLAAVLVFGAVRLASSASQPTVKVGLIASDAPTSPAVADEGPPTAALLEAYATRATALAAQGAQVIVLPEKLGVTVDPDTRATDARLQALAEQTHAMIVVGLVHVASPVQYNEARVYVPGAPVQSYHKQHMIPQFESQFLPGESLLLLSRSLGTWGFAICKDMDFTPLSRDYGRAGVGLMLVPAWDFNVDRLWHGHMAVMRGVESGFNLVRPAKNGYLTVSDNRGRILAETTSDSSPFATLLADVPTAHASTLYQQLGDWFAWLALALLAVAIARLTSLWSRSR